MGRAVPDRQSGGRIGPCGRQELDYTAEARHMDKIRSLYTEEDPVYIPQVDWDLTTHRILTMEYISGVKLSRMKELEKPGL